MSLKERELKKKKKISKLYVVISYLFSFSVRNKAEVSNPSIPTSEKTFSGGLLEVL